MPLRPGRRSSLRALVVLVATVLLAACRLDVGVDVALRADGTGLVTVTATADAELLARAPGALADLRLDDLRAGGWTVDGPKPTDKGGQQLVVTKPFVSPEQAASVLGELSGPNGPLRDLAVTVDRTFGTVRTGLTGSAGLEGGLAALGDAELTQALGGKAALADRVTGDVGDVLGLTVTARFPGRIEEANGTAAADGTAVTWTPELRGNAVAELRASFVQRDDEAISARSRARWARIGLAVWAGLVVLAVAGVIAAVALARRRRDGLT